MLMFLDLLPGSIVSVAGQQQVAAHARNAW